MLLTQRVETQNLCTRKWAACPFQTALHGAVAHNTQTSIRVLSQLAKWKGLHKVYYTADGATAIRGGKRKTVPMGLVCECVFKVQLKLHGPTKSISCTYFSTDMAKHNQTHPHPHTRTRAHVHAHAQQWQKIQDALAVGTAFGTWLYFKPARSSTRASTDFIVGI